MVVPEQARDGQGVVPPQDDGDGAVDRCHGRRGGPGRRARPGRDQLRRAPRRAAGSSACSASSRTVESDAAPNAHPHLTPRQNEVLHLLAHGHSTAQIADGAPPERRHRPQPRPADAARARRALADRGARGRASRGDPPPRVTLTRPWTTRRAARPPEGRTVAGHALRRVRSREESRRAGLGDRALSLGRAARHPLLPRLHGRTWSSRATAAEDADDDADDD